MSFNRQYRISTKDTHSWPTTCRTRGRPRCPAFIWHDKEGSAYQPGRIKTIALDVINEENMTGVIVADPLCRIKNSHWGSCCVMREQRWIYRLSSLSVIIVSQTDSLSFVDTSDFMYFAYHCYLAQPIEDARLNLFLENLNILYILHPSTITPTILVPTPSKPATRTRNLSVTRFRYTIRVTERVVAISGKTRRIRRLHQ